MGVRGADRVMAELRLTATMLDHGNQALRHIRKAAKLFEAQGHQLHPISVDAIMVKLLEAQQAILGLLNTLSRLQCSSPE